MKNTITTELSLSPEECFFLFDGTVKFKILRIFEKGALIGISAPRDINIMREEVYDRLMEKEND